MSEWMLTRHGNIIIGKLTTTERAKPTNKKRYGIYTQTDGQIHTRTDRQTVTYTILSTGKAVKDRNLTKCPPQHDQYKTSNIHQWLPTTICKQMSLNLTVTHMLHTCYTHARYSTLTKE